MGVKGAFSKKKKKKKKTKRKENSPLFRVKNPECPIKKLLYLVSLLLAPADPT